MATASCCCSCNDASSRLVRGRYEAGTKRAAAERDLVRHEALLLHALEHEEPLLQPRRAQARAALADRDDVQEKPVGADFL
jgi:hypothetical protein